MCLTLMVSKGCPEMTVQMPPNPPAKKFFTSLVLCFSVIVEDSIETQIATSQHFTISISLRSRAGCKTVNVKLLSKIL